MDLTMSTWLAIPLVTALMGWITNALAIEMMFRPVVRRGIGPVGWQGIVPARARKMAEICVDTMTSRLLTSAELLDRLEPAEVAAAVAPTLRRRADEIVDDVIAERHPLLWDSLPLSLRRRVLAAVSDEVPAVVEQLMVELREDFDELFDLRKLVVDTFVANASLLNELFDRCGRAEFTFIARSGLYFGGLFGLVQLAVWLVVQPSWFLPVTGVMVGWATNHIALHMVFRPLEPVKIGPWAWQGLFLARQEEVSAAYAAFFAEHILRPDVLLDGILTGPGANRIHQRVRRQVSAAVDEVAASTRPLVQLVVGPAGYTEVKRDIAERITRVVPATARRAEAYALDALDVEVLLRDRLRALTPAQFERVLHPIFEEDEWILVSVGAALGGVAGLLQLFLVSL